MTSLSAKEISFKEFLELYSSDATIAIGIDPMSFSYSLLTEDGETGKTQEYTHPDLCDAPIEEFMDFMADMKQAFENKQP